MAAALEPVSAANPHAQAPTRRGGLGRRTVKGLTAGLAGLRPPVEGILLAAVAGVLVSAWGFDLIRVTSASMAPTFRGKHYKVACAACGHAWEVDRSAELEPVTSRPRVGEQVAAARCPVCGEETAFTGGEVPQPGDRLLVDKLSYALRAPRRWEAVVFHDPTGSGRRFVKRIVGLPGETVRIHRGEVWTRAPGASEYAPLRKPPEVARALLTTVGDSRCAGGSSAWVASGSTWRFEPGGLVCDASGYNAYRTAASPVSQAAAGLHWVGDLALRLQVDVDAEADREAAATLELTHGRWRAVASWRPAEGAAQLELRGPDSAQRWTARASPDRASARLTLAQIDGQLFLWRDDSLVDFGEPVRLPQDEPLPTEADLAPAAFALQGRGLRVTRWQVLRDVYYTACQRGDDDRSDYLALPAEARSGGRDYLAAPERWPRTLSPGNLRSVEFSLGADEYLMLGDNSPRSLDSRLWEARPGVPRRLIVGRVVGCSRGGL